MTPLALPATFGCRLDATHPDEAYRIPVITCKGKRQTRKGTITEQNYDNGNSIEEHDQNPDACSTIYCGTLHCHTLATSRNCHFKPTLCSLAVVAASTIHS